VKRLWVVVLLLALTGCAKPAPKPVGSSPTPTPAGLKVGDTAHTPAGNTVTFHAWDATLPAADVEMCAGSGGPAAYNPLYFQLQLADNTRADPNLAGPKAPSLPSGTLAPGQCVRGWVSFVPSSERPVALVLATTTGEPVVWHLP
jgi:hypothetical protein